MNWLRLCVFSAWLAVLLFTPGRVQALDEVVGYYPDWFQWTLPEEDLDFTSLTRINHGFAYPDGEGELLMSDYFIQPGLVDAVHNAGAEILLSLGGAWNSLDFSAMASDEAARSRFITEVAAFCQQHGYDGVDIDWEYPWGNEDRANLTLFVQELRQAFDNGGNADWLITLAVPGDDFYGQFIDYTALSPLVDSFSIMTYDYNGWNDVAGPNAPLYHDPESACNGGSVASSVEYFTGERGIAPEQLLIGLPFYGKGYAADALCGEVEEFTNPYYRWIEPRLGNGWEYQWDELSMTPYIIKQDADSLIAFDDSLSLRHKIEYARAEGLRGVMIWALGQDVYQGRQVLLEAINGILGDTSAPEGTPSPPKTFELLPAYPNPFNSRITVPVSISRRMELEVTVHDIQGRRVDHFQMGPLLAGVHRFSWGNDQMASGVYFIRVRGEAAGSTVKVLLVR